MLITLTFLPAFRKKQTAPLIQSDFIYHVFQSHISTGRRALQLHLPHLPHLPPNQNRTQAGKLKLRTHGSYTGLLYSNYVRLNTGFTQTSPHTPEPATHLHSDQGCTWGAVVRTPASA